MVDVDSVVSEATSATTATKTGTSLEIAQAHLEDAMTEEAQMEDASSAMKRAIKRSTVLKEEVTEEEVAEVGPEAHEEGATQKAVEIPDHLRGENLESTQVQEVLAATRGRDQTLQRRGGPSVTDQQVMRKETKTLRVQSTRGLNLRTMLTRRQTP